MALVGLVTGFLAVLVAASVTLLSRSPIEPVVLDLGPIPVGDQWRPKPNLENLEKLEVCVGPEDITFDARGQAYVGCEDGWVRRIDAEGKFSNFSYTGGRPLGIHAREDLGVMYLANSERGLYEISLADGAARFIADRVEGGARINFADGVAITREGVVYITDASTKFGLDSYMLDVLEGRPNGRLLKYDPSTGIVSVVKSGLWFPNGLALSAEEDFLLMTETSRCRVMRLWLTGGKKGTWNVFLDELPGNPDNIKFYDGKFYIAIVTELNKVNGFLYQTGIGVNVRRLLGFLPHRVLLKLVAKDLLGRLLVVNPAGEIERKYEESKTGVMVPLNGGTRYGDYVYFTSLSAPFVGRVRVST